MDDRFADSIDELIAASRTVDAFLRKSDGNTAKGVETPSTAERRDKQFLRIPMRLWEVVVPLPGKAGHVYELLWRRHHMEKKPASVRLTAGERQRCKLTRWHTARAYEVLEEAGLITVERRVGKSPRITLCPVAGLGERQEPAP
jgi:hypothetical protein